MKSVAVIKNNVVIAFYGEKETEKELLRLVPQEKTEQRISGGLTYSYNYFSPLTFASVTEASIRRADVLQFLDDISKRWSATLGVQQSAEYHKYDSELASNFGMLIDSFSKDNDVTKNIKDNLDQVGNLLNQSINTVAARTERLELLDDKATELISMSNEFRNSSTNLRNKMRCSYYKSIALKVVIAIVVTYLLLVIICGGFNLKPNCRS